MENQNKKPEARFCVSSKERNQRLKKCNQCEHQIRYMKVCNLCACYIPWKTWFNNTSCPDNRW